MTIKELKAKKQIKATRRDNAFKNDADIQKAFEEQLKADGWKTSGYTVEKEHVLYSLFKEEPEQHTWYCKPENEKEIKQRAYAWLQRQSLPVSREYRSDDFLIIETPITRATKLLSLNRADFKTPEVAGVIVFRSKDYVFKFKNAEGKDVEVYGVTLKKDMITAEGLHYENERGVNLDYIFQE